MKLPRAYARGIAGVSFKQRFGLEKVMLQIPERVDGLLALSLITFARFMQEILPFWKLTFRTTYSPPNSLQLAINYR